MMDFTKKVFSRRQLLSRYFPGFAISLGADFKGLAQSTLSSPMLELIKEYKGAQVVGISSVGDLVCLYYFRHLDYFLRPWSYDNGETKHTTDVFRIVELNSDKVIYATQLRSMVTAANFFADGVNLYAEVFPLKQRAGEREGMTVERVLIDLHTRALSETLNTSAAVVTQYYALAWPLMMGVESNLQTSRAQELTLVKAPDFREISRAPFVPTPEGQRFGRPALSGNGKLIYGHDTKLAISGDRSAVVYGAGHHLVCRRTSDLAVVWSNQIGPDYLGAWNIDITYDGTKIAVAVVDGAFASKQEKCYIGIYSGRDGSTVNELQLNGFEGVSISPDGRMLGVSRRVPGPSGKTTPTVDVYETSSGSHLHCVSHPPVDVRGAGGYGAASIASRFTQNGKHLLTWAPNLTRVWRV